MSSESLSSRDNQADGNGKINSSKKPEASKNQPVEVFLSESEEASPAKKSKPSKKNKVIRSARRVVSYNIPRESYDRAMAFLNAPRERPLRRPRGSRPEPSAPEDPDAPRLHAGGRRPRRIDGRIEAGARVLARCQRVHCRCVMRFGHDEEPLDNYRPTDMTAMLCTISACIQREDWPRAIEIISMATHRTQTFQSRLALFRLAFVTLQLDPVLRGSNLLESFVQGCLDCHNDAEIERFMRMSMQIPVNVPSGELDALQSRRVRDDKQRLAMLETTSGLKEEDGPNDVNDAEDEAESHSELSAEEPGASEEEEGVEVEDTDKEVEDRE